LIPDHLDNAGNLLRHLQLRGHLHLPQHTHGLVRHHLHKVSSCRIEVLHIFTDLPKFIGKFTAVGFNFLAVVNEPKVVGSLGLKYSSLI
jgi:hypothetical protein